MKPLDWRTARKPVWNLGLWEIGFTAVTTVLLQMKILWWEDTGPPIHRRFRFAVTKRSWTKMREGFPLNAFERLQHRRTGAIVKFKRLWNMKRNRRKLDGMKVPKIRRRSSSICWEPFFSPTRILKVVLIWWKPNFQLWRSCAARRPLPRSIDKAGKQLISYG